MSSSDEEGSGLSHRPSIIAYGVHHHHYHMDGGSFNIGNAFKNIGHQITHTADNIGDQVKHDFSNPTQGVKTVAHYGIPAATSALGGAAGTSIGGPLGGIIGSAGGAYAGNKIDRAIGVGFKKRGRKSKQNIVLNDY